jgi:TolA-binding protein
MKRYIILFLLTLLSLPLYAQDQTAASNPKRDAKDQTSVSDPKREADDARYDNAYQLYRLKRYDQALAYFGEYLEVYTEGAHRKEALRFIGDIYLTRFDYAHALKYYSILYEEFSPEEEGIGGYYQSGVCYSRMGKSDKAIEIFRAIIDLYPASAYVQKARAQLDVEEIIK